MEKIKQVAMGEEFTSTRRLILKYRDKTMESHCRRGRRGAGWINLSYFSPQSWFCLIFSFVTLWHSVGTLARQSRESTGGTLKMMALHKGLSRGQACMCTTSLEMATIRDGHYHLLCFCTNQRVVRVHFLCMLNVCFVWVSFTWFCSGMQAG